MSKNENSNGNWEYPELLIESCRRMPLGFCQVQGDGRSPVLQKKALQEDRGSAVLEDIIAVKKFDYCQETGEGFVSVFLNLVQEAQFMEVHAVFYDMKRRKTLQRLDRKTFDCNSRTYDWEESFELSERIQAEDLAAMIYADWTEVSGEERHIVLLHENLEGALDPEYLHKYPHKESKMVKIEVEDGEWASPETAEKEIGNNENVVICFNRTPGFVADVDYLMMVKTGSLGRPMFSVPGQGTIRVDGAQVILGDKNYPCKAKCTVTRAGGGGGTGEQYDLTCPQKVFSARGKDLFYNLCISWNEEFKGRGGQIPNIYDYDLKISAYFQSEAMPAPQCVKVRVTSLDVKPSKGEELKKIPRLQIMWGCLEENTLILMADGSRKKICEIRLGEKVSGKDGRPNEVINIWKGSDEEITELCWETGKLRLTKEHPVLCEQGWVLAANIEAGMKVLDSLGSYVQIKEVKQIKERVYVYNLSLDREKEHVLFAEGIAVGDMEKQNQVL